MGDSMAECQLMTIPDGLTYRQTDDNTSNERDHILDDHTKCDTQCGVDLLRLLTNRACQGTCRVAVFIEESYVLAENSSEDAEA